MTTRAVTLLLLAGGVGVLGGSGLAVLAEARPNDPCSDFGSLPEGSSSAGSFELWPPRLRCEYHVGSQLARSTSFGPQTAELHAWIGAATPLAAFALLRRESAFFGAARPPWRASSRSSEPSGCPSMRRPHSPPASCSAPRSPSCSTTACDPPPRARVATAARGESRNDIENPRIAGVFLSRPISRILS